MATRGYYWKEDAQRVADAANTNVAEKPKPKPVQSLFEKPESQPITSQFSSGESVFDDPGLVAQGKSTIQSLLSSRGENQVADEAARSNYIKAANEAARRSEEAAALGGRVETGQMPGVTQGIQSQLLEGRRDLEIGLAAGAADRQRADQMAGIQGLLSARGQDMQRDVNEQQLKLQEGAQQLQRLGLDQQNAHFVAQLAQTGDLSRAALELERVGMDAADARYYAGLMQSGSLAREGMDIQRLGLAQSGDIARNAQELQRLGLEMGDAQFYAGLAQSGDLARRSLELEQTGMDRADARYYAGLEQTGTLAREGMDLQNRALILERLGMDRADARFYAQLETTSELEGKRLSLDEKRIALQEKGLDQADAHFYSGLAHDREMQDIRQKWQTGERLSNQDWTLARDDLNRVWQTGERLSTQDFEMLRTAQLHENDQIMAELTSTLGVDAQRQIDTWRNSYETIRQSRQFGHEEAMQVMRDDIARELQHNGHESAVALQTAELTARAVENDRNRLAQSAIETARLAQKDAQHRQMLGIERTKVAKNIELMDKQIQGMTTSMEREKLRDFTEQAAILMSLPGMDENPDMIAIASDVVQRGMLESGIISPEQYERGKLFAKADTFKDDASLNAWAQREKINPNVLKDYMTQRDSQSIPTGNPQDTLAKMDSGRMNWLNTYSAYVRGDTGYSMTQDSQGAGRVLLKHAKEFGIGNQQHAKDAGDHKHYREMSILAGIYDQNGNDKLSAYQAAAHLIGKDRIDEAIRQTTGGKTVSQWLK